MKAFIWLLTAAMAVLCCSCWAMAELVMRSLRALGGPLPNFTAMILRPHGWLLLVPILWVGYAVVLSLRKEVSVRAAFLFGGTIGFAMTSIACAVVVAAALPYISLKIAY